MISPPHLLARYTPAALLPTPVGPRMMTRRRLLSSNFDQEPDGEQCQEEEDGQGLFPGQFGSLILSRLLTTPASCALPSVFLTARTSADRISLRTRMNCLLDSSVNRFRLIRGKGLNSTRPSARSSRPWKGGARRNRISSSDFSRTLRPTGPISLEMYR